MNQGGAGPHYSVVAGLVWDRSSSGRAHLLIAKRKQNSVHAGLWEFPGGKVNINESLEQCLMRELKEELAIKIDVKKPFVTLEQDYGGFSITLHASDCSILQGQPQAIACQEFRWVSVEDLANYKFCKADQLIVAKLQKERKPAYTHLDY
jgi:mutator protein MutT